jgi:hypothetical protein
VFCSLHAGGPLDPARYAATLRLALTRAKVDRPMRPFHDGRHTSITNSTAAGISPAALMARAGHTDFAATQGYIDLAGETFREEAELLDTRLFGAKVGAKVASRPPPSRTGETRFGRGFSPANGAKRSGAGVEPTQRRVTPPHRF